jgi:SmpA / OmlA family
MQIKVSEGSMKIFSYLIMLASFTFGSEMGEFSHSHQKSKGNMNIQTPYFEMSPKEKEIFLEKVSQIDIGHTKEQVKKILGEATTQINIFPKKPNAKITGTVLIYYLRRWEKGLVNEVQDQNILIYFDLKDRVTKILKQRIEPPPVK